MKDAQINLHSGARDAPSCSRIEATAIDRWWAGPVGRHNDEHREILRTSSKEDGTFFALSPGSGRGFLVLCVSRPGYRTVRLVTTRGLDEPSEIVMVPLGAPAPAGSSPSAPPAVSAPHQHPSASRSLHPR